MNRILSTSLRIIFGLLLFGTDSIPVLSQSDVAVFKDVTDASGINFQYSFGDTTYENIMESSGAGISILDYNMDGNYDIYLLNGTYLEGISDPDGQQFGKASNQLFRNNGDGTFTDVTSQSGLINNQWSMASGIYDFDADGDPDIYLANYGPNVFYLNNGDGTFSDITDRLGLAGPDTLNGFTKWSVSVAFLDFNQDDRMDIFLGNFLAFDPTIRSSPDPTLMPHPGDYLGQASLLYQQNADGSFAEVTEELGLLYPNSKCMGLTILDVDGNGSMDIFQSNDHQPNFLFKSTTSDFQENGIPSGVAVNSSGQGTGSMHGTIGDINGDGKQDILVTDLKYGSLYLNSGKGVFKDVVHTSGVARHMKGKGGWAASLSDFDNDGDLDLFSANGTAEELITQHPLLLENTGQGKFINDPAKWGHYFEQKHSGRGAVVIDYDNDGDLDIIVSHVEPGSKARLLRNNVNGKNHWLGLVLQTPENGTSLIGTEITLEASDLRLSRVYQPSTGYLSYSDPRIHFGLGNRSKIDKIVIQWPDGTMDSYENMVIDRYLSVVKGKGIY